MTDWRHTAANHGEHSAGEFPYTCKRCAGDGPQFVAAPVKPKAPTWVAWVAVLVAFLVCFACTAFFKAVSGW